MPESAGTDSLMSRPVSPITDDDHDLFSTFINRSDELVLQPLGSTSSETSLSLRARPYSAKDRDVENLPENLMRHAPGLRNLISDWGPETFALVSSAVSLVALIILLARQDDQPLSTWTLPLSLNTVVSFLSATIKTPLAFVVGSCLGQGKWALFSKRQGPLSAFVAIEEAGRGPLGSLALMWKLKFRQVYAQSRALACYKLTQIRNWVCFGAGITIGLLAIDPFLQGLVQYVGKMSSMGQGSASMMRCDGLDVGEVYDDYYKFFQLDGQNISSRCYTQIRPDIALSLASQMGVVNASILRPVQPPGLSCGTGNCTWPPFSTLGIRTSCGDISFALRTDSVNGSEYGSMCVPRDLIRYELGSSYGQRPSPALTMPPGYENESYRYVV